jgi:hypothetical protein
MEAGTAAGRGTVTTGKSQPKRRRCQRVSRDSRRMGGRRCEVNTKVGVEALRDDDDMHMLKDEQPWPGLVVGVDQLLCVLPQLMHTHARDACMRSPCMSGWAS